MSTNEAQMTVTAYDLRFAALHGLPDTTQTKATTIRTVTPVRQLPESWVVQTVRQSHDDGSQDTIFVEYVGPDGTVRIALPHQVANAIVRQRDALSAKNRKAAAKAEAVRRKAAGIKPGFLKGK